MKPTILLLLGIMIGWAADTTMSGPLCKYQTVKRDGWDVSGCNHRQAYENITLRWDDVASSFCQTAKPHYDTVSWEAPCKLHIKVVKGNLQAQCDTSEIKACEKAFWNVLLNPKKANK